MDGADQSHTKTDRHAPDVNTAHGDRTGLHENGEQDTNNECGYEQQENAHASQSNGCNTDYGSFLNPDVLENIIETTVGRYPHMRQTLRAVSRFFKRIVDNIQHVPYPQIYLPELADVADIHHLSVRKIINIKGKNSEAVIALKHIINAKNWTNPWIPFVAYGYGWCEIITTDENKVATFDDLMQILRRKLECLQFIPDDELRIQYKDDKDTFVNLRLGDSFLDALRCSQAVSGTTFRRLKIKINWQPKSTTELISCKRREIAERNVTGAESKKQLLFNAEECNSSTSTFTGINMPGSSECSFTDSAFNCRLPPLCNMSDPNFPFCYPPGYFFHNLYESYPYQNSPLTQASTSSPPGVPGQVNGSPRQEAVAVELALQQTRGLPARPVGPLQLEEIRSRARLRHKTDGQRNK
ncbi:hypothetical protein ACROYT_G014358 [Oculina patagonica]